MELPKYHETFIPILKVLADGKPIHYRDLRTLVRDRFYSDLPKELLEIKTNSGDPKILNRIGWAKFALKAANLIDQPERGMVRITDKGLQVLKSGSFTLQDMLSDADYLSHLENAVQKNSSSEKTLLDGASPQDMIDSGSLTIENEVKTELLDKLKNIDAYYFQEVILKLLQKMGYGEYSETPKSGDGGIDGIINQDQLGLDKIYIQAKRYSENKVRETDIRNFIGAMSGDTAKGIFVTTSTFDEKAEIKAHDAQHKIVLIDGPRLVELMYKNNIGVQVKDTYEVKQVDEDFFENS